MCGACSHDDHDGRPCATCGAACWQPINVTGGDGDRLAAGDIKMATGLEQRPCFMCRHWEHTGTDRMARHFKAQNLQQRPDGKFVTPIAKDFPGRQSLVLDPAENGYCRAEGSVTEMFATCEKWTPTRSLTDFQQRMVRRP